MADEYVPPNPANLPPLEPNGQSVSPIDTSMPLFNNAMLAQLGITPAAMQGMSIPGQTPPPASFISPAPSPAVAAALAATPKAAPSRGPANDTSDQSAAALIPSQASVQVSKANPDPGSPGMYSADSNEDALRAAQGKQNDILTNAMFAHGAQDLIRGISGAGYTPNYGIADELNKNASIPVQNVIDLRKAQDQDVTRKASLLTLQNQQSLNDPKSDIANDVRNFAKDKLGLTIKGTETVEQLKTILPLYEKYQVAQQRSDDLRYKTDALGFMKQQAQSNKASDQQNKVALQTDQLLESARGNPSVAQAEKDLYAASKANSLANLYSDPNKLSTSQVNLLASEIGKIASGGVSTQSELEGITPNTLTGKLSKVTSQLTNKPTAANAAEFVKQYQDYTNALTKDAQKTIEDKYGRILASRKDSMGADNYAVRKAQYLDRFKEQAQAAQQSSSAAHGGKYPPGSVVSVKGQNYKVGADGDSLEPLQ